MVRSIRIEHYLIAGDAKLDKARELLLVGLLVLLQQRLHVLGNVLAKDMLAMHLGIELLALTVVAREALDGMRNVDTSVAGTLHDAKHTRTGGGASEADIEVGTEGARLVINILRNELLASNILGSLVDRVELVLLQQLDERDRGKGEQVVWEMQISKNLRDEPRGDRCNKRPHSWSSQP